MLPYGPDAPPPLQVPGLFPVAHSRKHLSWGAPGPFSASLGNDTTPLWWESWGLLHKMSNFRN